MLTLSVLQSFFFSSRPHVTKGDRGRIHWGLCSSRWCCRNCWNGPIDYISRDCNHCRGAYLAIGWCDPATDNEYRGYKTMAPETKEILHEEIFVVSADPFS
jgi:hypothetical protein